MNKSQVICKYMLLTFLIIAVIVGWLGLWYCLYDSLKGSAEGKVFFFLAFLIMHAFVLFRIDTSPADDGKVKSK